MSTLWFLDGPTCVVTDADDTLRYQGDLAAILPGLADTDFAAGIDAALQFDDDTLYLFRDDRYGRYDLVTNDLDEGYPLPTAEHWPGTGDTPAATRISAVAVLAGFQALLFCDRKVVPFDLMADKAGAVTTAAAQFAGMPEDVPITGAVTTDAALYLFAGVEYYRIDLATLAVDEGSPLPVEGNWAALSGFTPCGAFTLRNEVVDGTLVLTPAPPPNDTYSSTPARALTLDQAMQELELRQERLELKLVPAAKPGWVSFAEAKLHGVELRYWNGSVTQASALRNLDPRNAVALVRFAEWASTTYGVHTIAHIGVNGDESGARTDCHGQGRALDFAGVAGTRDGVEYDLFVLRDWGSRSVPDAIDPSGARLAQWPGGPRPVSYRLESDPGADPFATEVFAEIYALAASQWQDGDDKATGAAPLSTIGGRSFVMSPDHPSSNPTGKSGREAHANHLHMQIGATGRM